jgi:hypothetical protein
VRYSHISLIASLAGGLAQVCGREGRGWGLQPGRPIAVAHGHLATSHGLVLVPSHRPGQYHESLGVALVDCVLEDVRWGLDHPAAGARGLTETLSNGRRPQGPPARMHRGLRATQVHAPLNP